MIGDEVLVQVLNQIDAAMRVSYPQEMHSKYGAIAHLVDAYLDARAKASPATSKDDSSYLLGAGFWLGLNYYKTYGDLPSIAMEEVQR